MQSPLNYSPSHLHSPSWFKLKRYQARLVPPASNRHKLQALTATNELPGIPRAAVPNGAFKPTERPPPARPQPTHTHIHTHTQNWAATRPELAPLPCPEHLDQPDNTTRRASTLYPHDSPILRFASLTLTAHCTTAVTLDLRYFNFRSLSNSNPLLCTIVHLQLSNSISPVDQSLAESARISFASTHELSTPHIRTSSPHLASRKSYRIVSYCTASHRKSLSKPDIF
jgi:hypothetical protein